MIRVGVIGATGYSGAELVRILSGHPEVELNLLTSRQYSGRRFDSVFPSMEGMIDLVCEDFDADKVCDRADFLFIALPHKIPMKIVPELVKRGKKVVDLSADFRFSDASKYEAFYQPHTAKDLLEKAVYGLCEVYTERIKQAVLIGNPGCYPTKRALTADSSAEGKSSGRRFDYRRFEIRSQRSREIDLADNPLLRGE